SLDLRWLAENLLPIRLPEQPVTTSGFAPHECLLDARRAVRQERSELAGDRPAGVHEDGERAVEPPARRRGARGRRPPPFPGPRRRHEAVGLGYGSPEHIGRRAEVEAIESACYGGWRLLERGQERSRFCERRGRGIEAVGPVAVEERDRAVDEV